MSKLIARSCKHRIYWNISIQLEIVDEKQATKLEAKKKQKEKQKEKQENKKYKTS